MTEVNNIFLSEDFINKMIELADSHLASGEITEEDHQIWIAQLEEKRSQLN